MKFNINLKNGYLKSTQTAVGYLNDSHTTITLVDKSFLAGCYYSSHS